jgi:hypothetical protein
MPGFSQYSQVVKPAEYVEPVSLDLLAKGAVYKEQMLEQNLESINSLISNGYDIPSLQGIDTEKKNEIMEKVKQQASQLSYSELTNPAIANQLKGYINSVINDPDMKGIMQRGYTGEKIQREQQEAFDKNQTYWNQGLNDLQKYQSQGKYLRDFKITDNGGITPDMGSLIKKTKDILGEAPTTFVIDANGNQHSIKKYDEDKFMEVLQQVAGPQYAAYARHNFDTKYENVDPTEDYKEAQKPTIAYLTQAKAAAQAVLVNKNATAADKQEAQNAINAVDKGLAHITSLSNDPSLRSVLLDDLFNMEYKQGFSDAASTANAISTGKMEMTDATKLARELNNKLAEINAQGEKEVSVYKQKKEYDAENTTLATSKLDPLSQAIYKKAQNLSIDIMNDDGSLIPLQNVKDALQAKQEPFYIGMEEKNALDVIQAIKNGNIAFAAHMIFDNKSLWLGSGEPSMSYEDLKDKLKYDKGTNKFSWVNRNSVKKELTPSQIINATNLKDYDVDSEVIEPNIGRKERGSNKKIKF